MVSGVCPKNWANLHKSPKHAELVNARMGSSEFALVAFWDLDAKECMACKNFFIIPSPLKRMVKGVEGTEIY